MTTARDIARLARDPNTSVDEAAQIISDFARDLALAESGVAIRRNNRGLAELLAGVSAPLVGRKEPA